MMISSLLSSYSSSSLKFGAKAQLYYRLNEEQSRCLIEKEVAQVLSTPADKLRILSNDRFDGLTIEVDDTPLLKGYNFVLQVMPERSGEDAKPADAAREVWRDIEAGHPFALRPFEWQTGQPVANMWDVLTGDDIPQGATRYSRMC